MSDPIYVDSIKVSAGPFTVKTSTAIVGRTVGKVQIEKRAGKNSSSLGSMTLEELELLAGAIGEYLHMRSME